MAKKTTAKFSEAELKRLLRHSYRAPRQGKKWGAGRAYSRRWWTLEEMELLGTMTDVETARRLGRTRSSVTHKRRRLGIPPWTPQPPHWAADEQGLLGKLPDAETAKLTGRTVLA